MKKVETWKSWTFIGSLAAIAILINGATAPRQSNRPIQSAEAPHEKQQTPTAHPVKSPQELAAEKAKFIRRHLNDRPIRSAGAKTLAIVAVNEKGKLNGTLANVLANRVKGSGIKALTSLFTPEFVSEGLFKATFDDSPAPLDDLELREGLDMILLGRQTVEYTTNPSLENVLTASMTLEVKLVSVTQRGESQAWTFTSSGPGFKEADARKAAEERIIKQISTDTNISATFQ